MILGKQPASEEKQHLVLQMELTRPVGQSLCRLRSSRNGNLCTPSGSSQTAVVR
jgi:hypothetical protein